MKKRNSNNNSSVKPSKRKPSTQKKDHLITTELALKNIQRPKPDAKQIRHPKAAKGL